MSGKILVIGATGTIGQHVVANLVAQGEAVKAASRQGNAYNGAEGVAFDYTQPTDFDTLFQEVDRAYVMVPAGYLNALELVSPVIQAAAQRKIKVVLQTVLGVDANDSSPYRQLELLLERSGTPFVILRPNWFADNFHTYWRQGIQHGVIAVPAAEGKSSFIDVRDIAASAAAALTQDAFNGQAFNLTGAEALSYAEAAAILSEVLGHPITYQAIDDASFIAMLTNAGVPQDYAAFLASIFYPVRQGWTAVISDAVFTLTRQQPRTVRQYAHDNAAKLRG